MRWIEIQDLFFEQYKFERFIKVGPSLTLARKEIYYQFEDEPEVILEQDTPVEA